MFAKLLKHEFKSVKNTMFLLCGAALIAGILGGLIVWIMENAPAAGENIFVSIIGILFMIGTILILVGCCTAIPIILWLRFYKSKFSDEGYLTFTLPVTSHQILLSSLLNILIWMVISVLVAVIGICFILSPAFLYVDFNDVTSIFEAASSDGFTVMYSLTMLFGAISSILYSVVIPPMCITIGAQVARKYKLLAGFGIYYGLNMILSIITGIMSAISTFGSMALFKDNGETALLLSLMIPFVIQICLGVGGYFIMHRSIDRKLNLP